MTDLVRVSRLISTILQHDRKQTSYKLALLRVINDVALAYPLTPPPRMGVAVPLRVLAEWWLAYYFPFCDPVRPIMQGTRTARDGQVREDISFRPALTALRVQWEQASGVRAQPADGYFLTGELRQPHRLRLYPSEVQTAYAATLKALSIAIEQPIEYAGPKGGKWAVFERPQTFRTLAGRAVPLPGTLEHDRCLLIEGDLWQGVVALSLWIEALCIHEWCLFTERVVQPEGQRARRGTVYELLTARPDNRRPLTWERNQLEILLLEGAVFHCPWKHKVIRLSTPYDLDPILPLAIYPVNELWNLVPADRNFNQHRKRDRLPSPSSLAQAGYTLGETYTLYAKSVDLGMVLRADSLLRFGLQATGHATFAGRLTGEVMRLVQRVSEARHMATF